MPNLIDLAKDSPQSEFYSTFLWEEKPKLAMHIHWLSLLGQFCKVKKNCYQVTLTQFKSSEGHSIWDLPNNAKCYYSSKKRSYYNAITLTKVLSFYISILAANLPNLDMLVLFFIF
jgi:hypothetical protein